MAALAKLGLGLSSTVTGGGTGDVLHTGTLTTDLPIFGNGSATIKVGAKSGTGNELATSAAPTIDSPLFNTSIKIGNGSEPAAGAGNRGLIIFTQGGVGVPDSLRICVKLDDDTYAWMPIF